ncbi:MAG: hypothetical protein MJ248_04595 [Bacilli bacterium]|nr:hypothetical protein [Bacilli bacterium]
MKKTSNILCALAFLGASAITLAGCDKDPTTVVEKFSFTASLSSGKVAIEVGESDSIKILTNGVNDSNRVYTFDNRTPSVVEVDDNGGVTARQQGKAVIIVKEAGGTSFSVTFQVNNTAVPANGGWNFSNVSGADAVAKKTEILGKLEKYAVDSHLTGITLFEDGGYVKYSKRAHLPATKYITGYGWGLLSEGWLSGYLSGDQDGPYRDYYHTAQNSNPWKINAYNDSGSQVSDLFSYVSSSYWSTRLNENKNGYDWYPCLAADEVNGQPNNRPIHVGANNTLNLYRRWRIYVKTTANMNSNFVFRSANATYDGKPVTLADYEFAYRMLLTQSSKMSRGAEMAKDQTYGIKGAQAFYNATKNTTDAQALALWNNMKADGRLGFSTSADVSGYTGPEYIEIEIINDIDDFTAMYTLSSNLVSPMNEDFIKSLGDGTIADGMQKFGLDDTATNAIPQHTLGIGAYYLEKWDENDVCFKLNDKWFEVSSTRYRIPGVKIHNYEGDGGSSDKLYEYFQQGLLDSCGIPIKQISKEVDNTDDMGTTKKVEGSSTFKLNVNSLTPARWQELFGKNGKMVKNDTQDEKWKCGREDAVKPWMSNDNFLQGLYWSIDRKTFASNRGVNESIDYFANSYLSDPENGVSYNSTQAHKDALSKYHTLKQTGVDDNGQPVYEDDYGYNFDKAVNYFKTAVNQLKQTGDITLGTVSKPTEINIHIYWMNKTDESDYGKELASYFEKAFNNNAVSGGKVKLVVKQDCAGEDYTKVYDKMMAGQFDLAFGAISGNTYNPLNFLEVLKSDNSSTFTLNWGPDTSKVDTKNPIIYNGMKWSFDGLWECADRGGIVEEGASVKTVKNAYVDALYTSLENGGTIEAQLDFAKGTGIDITVDKVQVYNAEDSSTVDLQKDYNAETGRLTITITPEVGGQVANAMRKVLNREDSANPVDPQDANYVADPFVRTKYGTYFEFQVTYSLSINGGNPTQNIISLYGSLSDQNANAK